MSTTAACASVGISSVILRRSSIAKPAVRANVSGVMPLPSPSPLTSAWPLRPKRWATGRYGEPASSPITGLRSVSVMVPSGWRESIRASSTRIIPRPRSAAISRAIRPVK